MVAAVMLLAAAASAAPVRPTAATVARSVARAKDAVLRVVSGGRWDAVLIGPRGEFLTVAAAAPNDTLAVVQAGKRHAARVVRRDTETGVVLAAIEPAGDFRPPAVGKANRLAEGTYVIVLGHPNGSLRPAVTRLRPLTGEPPGRAFRIDAGLRPGSPVFNTRGELVAIQVDAGPKRARSVTIEWLRERLTTPDAGGL